MGRKWSYISVALLLVLQPPVARAAAAGKGPDYKLLNRIVACQSAHCVLANLPRVADKTERTVLYSQWLLLQPSSQVASKGLLENMPTTDREVMLLFTLSDWHEGATTSENQMEELDRIYTAWPRLLAAAVQRWPKFLPAYIRYGRLALDDIHSDYTGYEQRVCQAAPRRFKLAFHTLNAKDQTYIRKYVFDPTGCKPIFLSEAEGP